MQYENILKRLKALSNPKTVEGMARFGINPENTYGVSIPNLRRIAKEVRKNHSLAQQLWNSKIHEARILASMIDEPNQVTEKQMDVWIKDFDSWDVCDQCCMNLFGKTPMAWEKAIEWTKREKEFEKLNREEAIRLLIKAEKIEQKIETIKRAIERISLV